jgi:hypothetical protein
MPNKPPYVDGTLTEAEVIRWARCGQCWADHGRDCDPSVPGGWTRVGQDCFHPLRLTRAERRAGLVLAAIRGEL